MLATSLRTDSGGLLTGADVGRQVRLGGWVHRRRDLGGLVFIDLRDRHGLVQLSFDPRFTPAEVLARAAGCGVETVVLASGTVARRPNPARDEAMTSREVEVQVTGLEVAGIAVTPAIPVARKDNEELAAEELRLKHRILDLRRPELQANLILRHRLLQRARRTLSELGFLEIETPILTKPTPEGARDYLVPSRVHPGEFYALPQSPQIYKQLLMVAGYDRYFQIARCFRDEDLRADRQPEFTQIDLEMSYPQPERVWETVEGFLTAAFKAAGHEIKTPFTRMDFDDAIRQFGIDKPDLRVPAFTDVADCFAPADLEQLAINKELPVIAIRIPRVGELSRKERDDIKPLFVAKGGARIFEDFKRVENKFPEAAAKVRSKAGAAADDLLVLVVGSAQSGTSGDAHPASRRKVTPAELAIYASAGLLRVALAQKYSDRHKLFQKGDFRFLWVTNFPMFEWDEGERRWNAAHHPFTSPHDEDMDKLESDPAMVRALAYDVVLNGTELGSGSIRIHRQDVQSRIFRALGMTEEEARSRFGFFLDALEYGTPPHGGIALGLDRIVMILAGADSLREVIPFPKTAAAKDLMMEAPTPVEEGQLRELGIGVVVKR